MPRVFVSQWLFPDAIRSLEHAGIQVTAREEDGPLPQQDLKASLAGHDGLICMLTDRIDRPLLEANPELRVVANVAVGFDNIDVRAARDLGVTVTNTPGVLTDATADLTFGLLLATARRLPEADAFVRSGAWDRWKLVQEQTGLSVHGRTLGIIGMGRIGQAVAKRAARGFDMTVLYHQRTRLPATDEAAIPATYSELDDLLATSDFVSLHAPSSPQTQHLIGPAELNRMREGAILINTARGSLVDEAALATALRGGKIAGAGLDVFEDEPAVHPALLDLRDRVVLAPHLGSATFETRKQMASMAASNVRAVLLGEDAPDPVTVP